MKKLFFLFLIIAGFSAYAQDFTIPNSEEPKLVFEQENFKDQFVVIVDQDENYHYVVTDLTKFSNSFEKAYFLNLAYQDHQVISIDSDLSKDQLWFKAPISLTQKDVKGILEGLREQVAKQASVMTDEEKSTWTEKHSKFNEKKD